MDSMIKGAAEIKPKLIEYPFSSTQLTNRYFEGNLCISSFFFCNIYNIRDDDWYQSLLTRAN